MAQAGAFKLECKTLNPTTRQVQTKFAPGDDILLVMTLDIPEEAKGKKVDIQASISFKMNTLGISFSIPNIKLSSPYEDPRGESVPFAGNITEEKIRLFHTFGQIKA